MPNYSTPGIKHEQIQLVIAQVHCRHTGKAAIVDFAIVRIGIELHPSPSQCNFHIDELKHTARSEFHCASIAG